MHARTSSVAADHSAQTILSIYFSGNFPVSTMTIWSRQLLLVASLLTAAWADVTAEAESTAAAGSKAKPHILFLLADDLGWANIGYHRTSTETDDEKQGALEAGIDPHALFEKPHRKTCQGEHVQRMNDVFRFDYGNIRVLSHFFRSRPPLSTSWWVTVLPWNATRMRFGRWLMAPGRCKSHQPVRISSTFRKSNMASWAIPGH